MAKVFAAHLHLPVLKLSEILFFSKSPTTGDLLQIVQSRIRPSHVPEELWNAIQKERTQVISEGLVQIREAEVHNNG